MDRNYPGVFFFEFLVGIIDAGNVVPHLSETGTSHQAYISGTDNGNSHDL